MTFDLLAYEFSLLLMVNLTLLFIVVMNRELREPKYLLGGFFLVAVSRALAFTGEAALIPLFYVTTASGYFLLVLSAIKLTNHLRSAKALEQTAFFDPLTKAYNRGFIEEVVKEEILKAKRLKEEFCILLIDLNDFKQVNDRYGHNAGDLVLKRIVEDLRRHLREYDMIARWGGDEFLVVLPAEKHTDVLEVANRLVSDFVIKYKDIEVTLSVGYACFPYDGDSLARLVEIADSRMYRSKTILKEVKKYAVDDKSKEEV